MGINFTSNHDFEFWRASNGRNSDNNKLNFSQIFDFYGAQWAEMEFNCIILVECGRILAQSITRELLIE